MVYKRNLNGKYLPFLLPVLLPVLSIYMGLSEAKSIVEAETLPLL